MTGWAVLSSRLPGVLSVPVGFLLIATGVALAWGRAAGRPLDRWAWLFLAYRARPRRGSAAAEPIAAIDNIVRLPSSPRRPDLPAVGAGRPARPTVDDRPGTRTRARRALFFSFRGGSGRTALATEIAALIASSTAGASVRVALLDLDFSSSSVRLRLGLDGPDITELLAAADPRASAIERVLLRHESGLRVVLGPASGPVAVDAFTSLVPRLSVLLAYLDEQHFDVVIVDTNAAPGDLQAYLCEAVDDIYYVFAPTPAGVCDLYRGVGALRRAGHRQKLRLVLNHADAAVNLDETFADLRLEPAAEIPTLPAIATAEDRHIPASLSDEFMGAALRDLAAAVYPDVVVGAASGWIANVGDEGLQAGGLLAQR